MEQLSDAVLRNCSLPTKLDPIELTGKIVKLSLLDIENDSAVLFERLNGSPITLGNRSFPAYDSDELVWKYLPSGPYGSFSEFRSFLQDLMLDQHRTFFCVFDIETNSQIGVVCILNNAPKHLKAEIGWVVFSPIAQRTGASMEACYLLLQHMFHLGYRRIEWKCNALNKRSREAALKIGFTFEGVQPYHMIVKGCSRDSAWFRILDFEWNDAKIRLENRIYNRE